MKHEEMQVLVSAYHDGEVTAEERALVEAHLAECAACAEALAAYGRLGRAVQSLPRGAAPRTLWPHIREGLSAPIRRPLWLRLAPLASVAALLVVGVSLVLVMRMGLGQPLAAPMAQQSGADTPAAVASVRAPAAVGTEPGEPGLSLYGGALITSSVPRDETNKGLLAACPGRSLALDMVGLSVRSDARLATPRLQGVLYDAQGQPLPGVVLVISGTAGWRGSASTAADGTFALDLPAAGTYQVVLALAPTAPSEATADAMQLQARAARSYEVALPSGEVCLSPGSSPAPVPFTLAAGEEAILTLRSP